MMRRWVIALLIVGMTLAACMLFRPPERFVVYYSDRLPADTFMPYDVLVFDRQGHPPLQRLEAAHKTLLGYISLGEAEPHRDNFLWLKEHHLLLQTGPEWKGSNPVIDVRKPEWAGYMLDVLIPETLRQGFNGIMLDTSDSLIWLEHNNPTRYAGLQDAAADIIHQIRMRYPTLTIMLNRGFGLLPKVAGDINMVLAESIYPSHPKDRLAQKDYRNYIELLNLIREKFPHIKIYTIDYYLPSQASHVPKLYTEQRSHGFIPYVTIPGLQEITPEPH